MTVVAAAVAIPATPYDPACLVVDTPIGIIVFMVGTSVTQTVLLCLAYRKKSNVARFDHQRHSVAWITIRDGIFAFAILFGELDFLFSVAVL